MQIFFLIVLALIAWILPLGYWEERLVAVGLVLWYFAPGIEDGFRQMIREEASRSRE